MKLKDHYSKLQDLLRETITLLCKSGLDYKVSFNVDAVIGITVDGADGFYVTLQESYQNETVSNEASSKVVEESDVSEGDCSVTEQSFHQKKLLAANKSNLKGASRRKRQPEHGYIVNSSEQPASSKKQKQSFEVDDQEDLSDTSSNLNIQDVSVKCEPSDYNEDLIFVKTESDKEPLPQRPPFSDPSQSVQLGSLPAIPTQINPAESALAAIPWNSQQIPSMAPMRFSSSVSVPQQANPSVCPLCAKVYRYKQGLKDHMRAVHGMGDPYTCQCGQTFMWRMTRDQHKKTCAMAKEGKLSKGARSRKGKTHNPSIPKGSLQVDDNLDKCKEEGASTQSEMNWEIDNYGEQCNDNGSESETSDGKDKLKVVVNQILASRRNGSNS